MKIAVSVWEGKISPVFDTASRLLILDVEGRRETSRSEIYLEEQALTRKCMRIEVLGIDILICGAISRPFYDMLSAVGINVIPWICGPEKDVLQAYMEGTLLDSRFSMPGCDRKKGRRGDRAK